MRWSKNCLLIGLIFSQQINRCSDIALGASASNGGKLCCDDPPHLLFSEIDGDDKEGRVEEVMISRMRGWSWGGVEEICNVSRSICSGSSRRASSSAKRVMRGWSFLR